MIKKLFLALLPLTMLTMNAKAEDMSIDLNTISDASVQLIEADLDIDVDELSEQVEESDDAIEACFRRFGYRHRGWGYGYNYGGCFHRCYNVYRPMYTYRTISYCAPVMTHICRPVYNCYWGCY